MPHAPMMMSSGGTHNLNVFVLLDEDTAKDNGPVAKQLEKICKELDCNFGDLIDYVPDGKEK